MSSASAHSRPTSTWRRAISRPAKRNALNALPPEQSERAFFHVWTRKEAFLKATGLGLSHGLERFEVSVPPDEPCRLLHIDGDAEVAARWTLRQLGAGAGYVGALAVEGTGYEVEVTVFSEERLPARHE